MKSLARIFDAANANEETRSTQDEQHAIFAHEL